MSSLIPIEDDELLAEVLAHSNRRKSSNPNTTGSKRNADPSVRDYNTWFKLKHRFIHEVPGLPELSGAKCSNPQCSNPDKPRGAIATVPIQRISTTTGSKLTTEVDMCRDCFLSGYPVNSQPQQSLV